MKTVVSIILITLFASACKVNKTSSISQTDIVEKTMPGKWIVKEVKVPGVLKNAPKENGQKSIEEIVAEIKNKALLSFKSDHTFTLTMGEGKDIQSGTWKLENNGDITVTDDTGKSGTFKSDALAKGYIDILFQMGSKENGGIITLHLIKL